MVADSIGAELDRLVFREMEDRFPRIFEPVRPAARNAIVCFPPAKLIHVAPTPPPPVGDHQVHHVQTPLAALSMLFNIQEERSTGSQDCRYVHRHVPEPLHVLISLYRPEVARFVILKT